MFASKPCAKVAEYLRDSRRFSARSGCRIPPLSHRPSPRGPSGHPCGLPRRGQAVGKSILVRGLGYGRYLTLDDSLGFRSIPTCVGTTRSLVGPSTTMSVHPHVRGDYGIGRGDGGRVGGPSPRAWGLLRNLDGAKGTQRSIPTCVGTTIWHMGRKQSRPVHPHVRGDYWVLDVVRARATGPSPRAWGLLPARPPGRPGPRSIPTCVGTTLIDGMVEAILTVHPHVRGDYLKRSWPAWRSAGPSPRAWGLHMTQTAKTPSYPLLRVCKENYSEVALSRSPRVALAMRLSFSALRKASAVRTDTNTIPSKSRKERSW